MLGRKVSVDLEQRLASNMKTCRSDLEDKGKMIGTYAVIHLLF